MALDPEKWEFEETATGASLPIGEYKYRESKNSGTGSLGDNPTATRTFLVDWLYLAEFMDDIIGYAETPSSGAGMLVRTLPEPHPDLAYFYATDCQYRPLGVGVAGTTKSTWRAAEVTVTYKPLPYGVYADDDVDLEIERFVSIETMSKAEFLTANNVGMQFVSRTENKSVQTSPGVIIPSIIEQYTWHNLPAPSSTVDDPLAEFRPPCRKLFPKMIGRTNYTTFATNPPRTMVLIDVTPERLMPNLTSGLYRYNLTYTFDVRNHGPEDKVGSDEVAGVDYIYDIANTRWDLITTTGDTSGKRILEAAEFNDLFVWSE